MTDQEKKQLLFMAAQLTVDRYPINRTQIKRPIDDVIMEYALLSLTPGIGEARDYMERIHYLYEEIVRRRGRALADISIQNAIDVLKMVGVK